MLLVMGFALHQCHVFTYQLPYCVFFVHVLVALHMVMLRFYGWVLGVPASAVGRGTLGPWVLPLAALGS